EVAKAAFRSISELRMNILVAVVYPIAKVLIQGGGVDDLAGIHDVGPIEEFFVLAKGIIHLGAEKLFVVGTSHEAVAVLTAPGSTVFHDEFERFVRDAV